MAATTKYSYIEGIAKQWFNRRTSDPLMRETNKDDPEASLKAIANGDIGEASFSGLAADGLSTWHLLSYQEEAFSTETTNFTELATSMRFMKARWEFEQILVKNGCRSDILPPYAALSLCMAAILNWPTMYRDIGHIVQEAIHTDLLDMRLVSKRRSGLLYRHFWFTIQLYSDVCRSPIDIKQYVYPDTMLPYEPIISDWRTLNMDKLRTYVDAMAEYHVDMAQPATSNH